MPVSVGETVDVLASTQPEALGDAILRTVARVWDDPQALDAWLGLVRSAVADERAAAMLREFLSSAILAPVAQQLGSNDAAYRVSLVASQIVGLGIARFAVGIEPLASTPIEELIDAVAPTLQHYLTGDIPTRTRNQGST
jgi:hypothetical protein